jgi:membrane-associated phospholipid phosphatase
VRTPALASTPSGESVSPARAGARSRWVAAAWRRRTDPGSRRQAFLLVALVAAVLSFAHLAEDYLDRDAIVRWDVEFSRWLHAHSSDALLSFFKLVTYGGNVVSLAVLTAAVAAILFRRGRVNEAALLCAVALGIEVLNAALKLAFQRPRPELAFVHLDTYSFPSGHAAGSAAIYAALFYVAARRGGLGQQVVWAGAYIGVVVLIGFSRLYLEAHYLSDVLAGVSLGAAWVAACLFVYELQRHSDLRNVLPRRLRAFAGRTHST